MYNNYINSFLYEKELNEGLSLNTIKSYKSVFNSLINSDLIDIDDSKTFTSFNFKIFLGNLFKKNKWSSFTYNRYKKNLKVFCDYLVKEGFLEKNPLLNVKFMKCKKALPKYLTTKQVGEIKKQIDLLFIDNDFFSIRNKTILFFYLYSGLRLYELINLNLDDINFLDKTIRVKNGKGKKERYVPLLDNLSDLLFVFINLRKKYILEENNLLFTSLSGKILQHRDIYKIFDKVKSKLSFSFTPHMLRHTFATELVRKNINLYSISRVLGHSDLKTTKIYLNLDLEKVTEDINLARIYS